MNSERLSRGPWDLVIVGGGTAGSVLAARLAEAGDRSVLLLEAGPDYRSAEAPTEMNSRFHLAALDGTRMGEYQWAGLLGRNTTAQQPAPFLRGRGLGGSSAINGRGALRAPMDDFEEWEALAGPDWAPDRVLESLVALEDDLMFGEMPYHGRGGPIAVSREPTESFSSVHLALVDAALAVGEPWFPDFNAPDNMGISLQPYIGVPGRRFSTNDGYLEPARDRPNLEIVGGALVDRVLTEHRRAVGIVARIGREEITIPADEVILAAGTVHSPAILMRSGVGPADDLRTLGIEVQCDLPVGRGVQDHPSVVVALPLDAGYREPTGEITTGIFIRSATSGPRGEEKDLIFFSNVPEDPQLFPFALLCGLVARADSRGTIRLRSLDPEVHPEIDLRMLSDERDLVRARLTHQRVLELANTPQIRQATAGAAVPCNFIWGSGPQLDRSFAEFETEAALDRWLAETAMAGMHVSSSCQLGSVVGPDCSVLGIERLRVADMSIAPTCPRANTLLTAIMIGERLARIMAEQPATAGRRVTEPSRPEERD